MTFTHVLVPTDFSASAEQALRYALAEAAVHHAKVTLLHVLPPHTETEVYYVAGAPRAEIGFDPALEGRLGASSPARPTVVLQDHEEEALTRLRDLMRHGFDGPWEVEVATGPLANTIIRVALISSSWAHGCTGLQHMLHGSVAARVVRLAPCPVLTVR